MARRRRVGAISAPTPRLLLLSALLAAPALAAAPDAARLLSYWQPGRGTAPMGVALEAATGDAAGAAVTGTPEERLTALTAALADPGAASRGVLLLERSEVLAVLAREEESRGDRADAIRSLSEEVAAEPRREGLRLALALALRGDRRPDEARAVVEAGLDLAPGAAPLLLALLEISPEAAKPRHAACEAALRASCERDPTDRDSLCWLVSVVRLQLAGPLEGPPAEAARAGRFAELDAGLGLSALARARSQALSESLSARRDEAVVRVVVAGMALHGAEDALLAVARTGDPELAAYLAPVPELLGDLSAEPVGDLSCFSALALSDAARGDADGLIRTLEAATAAHPDVPALRARLAEAVLELQDDPARARAIAEAGLERGSAPTLSAALAWIALRAGDGERAKTHTFALLDELGRSDVGPEGLALYRRAVLILAGLSAGSGDLAQAGDLVGQLEREAPSPSVAVDRAILLALGGITRDAEEILAGVAVGCPRDGVARALLAELGQP